VAGIVVARLIACEHRPLIELLGPLMGVIVGPFMDETAVAQEIEAGDRLARELREQRSRPEGSGGWPATVGVWVEVPDVLRRARAFRVRQCLLYVVKEGRRGLGPSNQEVGASIGVSHRGQVSMLLTQLARLGLLVKCSRGPGHANVWRATAEGELVAGALGHE
jgi:hypothetical protein